MLGGGGGLLFGGLEIGAIRQPENVLAQAAFQAAYVDK